MSPDIPNNTMASLPRLSSCEEYTIGWIAALYIERMAAVAMLDVEHGKPDDFRPRADPNSYAWGSIGSHNVVIASLPSGEYGTVSAAAAARYLALSFPSVRFGLLVGIGAGIPQPGKDIRLGDIVVSRPSKKSGGVVQYDRVDAVTRPGLTLQPRGILNAPPTVLLNAVGAMQARHEMAAPLVPSFLQQMISRFPQMANQDPNLGSFCYQGADEDRLFEDTYFHASGDDCASCDPSRQIQRVPRGSDVPEIHYGVIASGDALVKNARAREELAKQTGEDCICFEMEAAGLMNTFPCLVIRGICDYADSHKNDRWQKYAAATAAAYGKELLGYIHARDIGTIQPVVAGMDIRPCRGEDEPFVLPLSDQKQSEGSVGAPTPHAFTPAPSPGTPRPTADSTPGAIPPPSSPGCAAPDFTPPISSPGAVPSGPVPWPNQHPYSSLPYWAYQTPFPHPAQWPPFNPPPWTQQPPPFGHTIPANPQMSSDASDVAALTNLVGSLTTQVGSLTAQVSILTNQVIALTGLVTTLAGQATSTPSHVVAIGPQVTSLPDHVSTPDGCQVGGPSEKPRKRRVWRNVLRPFICRPCWISLSFRGRRGAASRS